MRSSIFDYLKILNYVTSGKNVMQFGNKRCPEKYDIILDVQQLLLMIYDLKKCPTNTSNFKFCINIFDIEKISIAKISQ